MTNETTNHWAGEYEFTTMLVHRLVNGLTQAETLLQLPFRVNYLNWVLGHIVTNRIPCSKWPARITHGRPMSVSCIKPAPKMSGRMAIPSILSCC